MPRRKAAETPTDKKRKLMVEAIFTAQSEGKTLAEAWLLTHPESKAKPESRRVMAQEQLAWYIEKYPSGYEQLMRRRDAQERRRQRRRENHRRRELDIDAELMASLGLGSPPELITVSGALKKPWPTDDRGLPATFIRKDGRYYLYDPTRDKYDLVP